jgi:lactoylglutathione lyase
MAFLWTTVHVNNLEESIKFYEKYVGLRVSRRFESRPGVEIAFLGDGETELELIGGGEDYPESDQISLGFSVDSMDKKMDEMKQAGIGIYKGPIQPNPHIKFFYVKDPNGISVQFAEQMK